MCLIITGSARDVRSTLLDTKGLLLDIFKYNSDGVGAMYRNKRGLRVVKIVPSLYSQVEHLVQQLPDDDRSLALHFRMTTHGHTDLDNCHPYPVADGVAMMHNGILACGNAKDKSRSDTYHFIEEFLAGTVAAHPKVIHQPGFLALVGDYIDNNRFVFMDSDGEMSIVNEEQGTKHGGLWFSNEYAWSPELLIPGYAKHGTARYYGGWSSDDDDHYDNWKSRYGSGWTVNNTSTSNVVSPYAWSEKVGEDFVDAITVQCDAFAAGKVLSHTPYMALGFLFDRYVCQTTRWTNMRQGEMTAYEKTILEHALDHDLTWLRAAAGQRPSSVADVLCYYLDWEERTADDGTVDTSDAADAAADDAEVQLDIVPRPQVLPDSDHFWYCNHEVQMYKEKDGTYAYLISDHTGNVVDADGGFVSRSNTSAVALSVIDTCVAKQGVDA